MMPVAENTKLCRVDRGFPGGLESCTKIVNCQEDEPGGNPPP